MVKTFIDLTLFEQGAILLVVGAAIISLIYAWWLRKNVLAYDKGTEQMQEIWNAIREGADSYLRAQLKKIIPLIIILSFVLFLSVYIVEPSNEAITEFKDFGDKETAKLIIATGRLIAFILGASFSLIVGQFGMRIAVQANIRVAQAARTSYNEALKIAYHGGTFTGMLTDGLGLMGGTLIFIVFGLAAPDALLGFGFGGTLLALFMRVGGGIYTKAADIGADLVGKVEQDLPEDDPRNAAVIADLVGDNVGDCAGMAADIFESYEVTIVSALILAIAIFADSNHSYYELMALIIFPLVVRAIGVISSIIGTYTVSLWSGEDAEKSMFKSYEVSSIFTILVTTVFSFLYFSFEFDKMGITYNVIDTLKPAFLIAVGVGLAVSFNPLTSYFTAANRSPVQEIKRSTTFGSATTILQGLSIGFESSVWALVVIAGSFVISIFTYYGDNAMILYGIALVGIGMLSHTGNNVAMDSFGPIADNASGIGEVAGMEADARKIMADLDAVGNTTKAITKGVAIASAVIAAVALFSSFITDINRIAPNTLNQINIADPIVFVGLLLGGALPWLFAALILNSVARGANQVVKEVREQFKIPGVMERTVKPNYARVVEIATVYAQKELIALALITICVPVIIGLVLQVEALGGFLGGIIVSGQLLAVFMANSGGAWDNAKKCVEDEPCDPDHNLGKGSERHKASVVGDTVGDPLKDTAGPAINPMIKVVNLISLIIAPVLVQYSDVDYENILNLDISIIPLLMLIVISFLTFLTIISIIRSKKTATTILEDDFKELEGKEDSSNSTKTMRENESEE